MYSQQYVPTISVKHPATIRTYQPQQLQPIPIIRRQTTLNKQLKQGKISKLSESITCKICFKEGRNPVMCPHCQQMYCDNCIKKWLDDTNNCANCHNNLRKEELVSCLRLYSQITNAIQTVREVPICSKHDLELSYYCETCDTPVCSDCAVVDQQVSCRVMQRLHNNHIIGKISQLVTKRQQTLKSQIQQLNEKKKILKKNIDEISQEMISVKELREQNRQQLQQFKKNLQQGIQTRYKQITQHNQNIQTQLQQKWKSLKLIYQSVTSKLNNYSKSKFLFEQQNILRQINESVLIRQQQLLQQQQQRSNPLTMFSELVPTYDTKTFFIRNYTTMRNRQQIIFTETFKSRGLQWRLKIYPHGSQTTEPNSYISIFVELVKGLIEGRMYKYKIETVNQKNREKKISKEYESLFETGEIWGYNTYSKISTLYEENYIHPEEDYLEIVLHIKSPSFYTQVLDQEKLIENKKAMIEENRKRIKALKERLKGDGGSSKDGEGSFISLDDICQVQGFNRTPPDSPQIEDQQIYAPVIKPRH